MAKDDILLDAGGRFLDDVLTLEELARETGVSARVLLRFVHVGLIDPLEPQAEPLFPAAVLPRVWRIQRLRRDLRLNLDGVGAVLALLERVEELERELLRRR